MHVLIILSMIFMAACEPSPKQARRELIALDYSYSRNSMAEAIRKEDSAALELFLRAGIEPDAVSAGYSMLEHASKNPTLVAILLAAGADPNTSGGVSTPLIEAVSHGTTAVATILLKAGADIDQADATGRTPLMAAAEQGAVALCDDERSLCRRRRAAFGPARGGSFLQSGAARFFRYPALFPGGARTPSAIRPARHARTSGRLVPGGHSRRPRNG